MEGKQIGKMPGYVKGKDDKKNTERVPSLVMQLDANACAWVGHLCVSLFCISSSDG